VLQRVDARLFREQVDELHVSTADDSAIWKLIGEQQEHSQRISTAKSELIHRIGELLEGVVISAAV
jgi:hypothetical protein